MKPSDRAHLLQVFIAFILVTPSVCHALTPQELRWEKADLIVEGKITGTQTVNGEQVQTLIVDRILKTEHMEVPASYSKGYVEGLELQIPASSLSTDETQLLFLENTSKGYRIIAAEPVENHTAIKIIEPGFSGLLMLILLAILVSQRHPIIPEKRKENYS
jgi:hypothetical protein